MDTKKVSTVALLGIGPLASLAILSSGPLSGAPDSESICLALLVAWCPFLFLSVPALVLQRSRDRALPQLTGPLGGPLRALALVPHELSNGTHKAENVAALVGWAALVPACLGPALSACERLLSAFG